MGNKMVDYLEKQIILDYHFRGEQDIFEQEFPSLKTKAESFIGYETYFGLSPLTGSPLSEEEHPEHFTHLMKIQNQLNQDLDATLSSHNYKLNQFNEVLEGRITSSQLYMDKVANENPDSE